jgi:hypothetical protein
MSATVSAGKFTSEEFLGYDKNTKENYVVSSAGMAGLIAAQNDKDQAECIARWLSRQQDNGFSEVFSVMQEYSGYHPQGVVLGVIEKECGNLDYQ